MGTDVDAGRRPSTGRFLLFFVGMGLCAVSQWFIFQRTEWYWSSWGLVVGALIAAWAVGRPSPLRASETAPLSGERVAGTRANVGAAATLAGFVGAVYGSWLLSTSWRADFELGWILVVAGTLTFSGGLAQLDRRFRKAAAPLPWLKWEVVAFVAIVLLGLFLRFYRYDFPPYDGICAIEEPQSGQGALAIRLGDRPWEFLLDRWIALISMDLLGDTLTAIRIPFTILSWLTIIPLYLLLRELVSRPAALVATLFFAFCRWHLVYARSAHNIFGPTLPLILVALWLSVRAYRRGGLAAYPLIGLICAYSLYTYAGYRGTTAFIGLFFVISLLQHFWNYRKAVVPSQRNAVRLSLRNQAFGIVLAGFGFGLLVVPLYFQLQANPAFFLESVERATNNPQYYHEDSARMLEQRVDRLRDTAMMFNHLGDGSAVFNMPGQPQLDPVSGTLLVLGLAYCILWAGTRMQGYFAAYFLILLAFGTIFVHNFDIRRLQGIIPLIFILAAFFLDGAGHFVRRRLGRVAWLPLTAVAVLFGGIAFAANYNLYFRDMMSNSTVRQAFHTNYTIAIRYYHDMPEGSYLQLISDMGNFFEPSDYAWWRGDRLPGDTSHDVLPLLAGESGPWDGRTLHVLVRMPTFEGEEIAELIQKRFPQATCDVYRHPDGPLWATFMSCRIGPDSYGDGKSFAGGIAAAYYRGGSTTPLLSRIEPAISYGLVPDECRYPTSRVHIPCNAVWEGTWEVPAAGTYQLMANVRNGTVRVAVDGRLLESSIDSPHGDARILHTSLELTPGPHHVRVESQWEDVQSVGTRLRYRLGGNARWQLIEFADLVVDNPTDPTERTDPTDPTDPSMEPPA